MKENYIDSFSKSTESKLYTWVKANLQAICAAAIKTSIQSYVQSLFSGYEEHMSRGETETTKVGPHLVGGSDIVNGVN